MKDYRTIIDNDTVEMFCTTLNDYLEDSFEGCMLDNYFFDIGNNNMRWGRVKPRKYVMILEKGLNEWSSVNELYMTDSEKKYRELFDMYYKDREEYEKEEETAQNRRVETMKERELRTAKKFSILDKCKSLERELLQINRVEAIEFDLNGFYSDIYQVIILARYDIPITLENYFETRKEVVKNIIKVAGNYGLTRTEDSIEDYGTTFYFVFRCSKEWKNKEN